MMHVTERGLDAEAAMRRAAAEAPAAAVRIAGGSADLIAQRARQLVPTRTGRARGSITVVTTKTTGTVTAGGGRARYFGWLEYGGTRGRPYRRGGRYIYPAAGDVWRRLMTDAEREAERLAKTAAGR